jgi:hypothetical protein
VFGSDIAWCGLEYGAITESGVWREGGVSCWG